MAPSFKYSTDQLYQEALQLLSELIRTPSISREENLTADLIQEYLQEREVTTYRKGNNVWAQNQYFDESKPTVLLNSHHDTVKPNKGYSKDPFEPEVTSDRLYGLGSNDAGGALVSLLMTFLYFNSHQNLKYNLLFVASAEEEISGAGGIRSILSELGEIAFGIVGEPTEMNMAIFEKGLMVLDCVALGQSGHAARDIGDNAIYKAIEDIQWFKNFQFPKSSETLGPIKMSVTMVESGSQHNVIPDTCNFVVDVRTTDAYTNEETLAIIRQHVRSEVKERSTLLQPSRIDRDHEIVQAADALGMELFGSPTMSDQALIPFPTVKIGPGISERSHTADEYIELEELKSGILGYLALLHKTL